MDLYYPLWTSIILFILGTVFGSFGGVLIERLADDWSWKNIKSILTGRSICPQCEPQRELARYELIPIISWIRQGGTCTQCNNPIPSWYLRLEIASGLVFVMTYLRTMYNGLPMTELVRRTTINWLLLLILVYDLQTQYLHTIIRYFLIIVILAYLSAHRQFVHDNRQLVTSTTIIWSGLMGLIRRGASLYAQRRYGQPEGIGSGDVIIIATLAPLLPFVVHYIQPMITASDIFITFQLFFRELIIGSIISLLLALILHKNKAGQTLAFLPGLIIAWRVIGRIAPLIIQQ